MAGTPDLALWRAVWQASGPVDLEQRHAWLRGPRAPVPAPAIGPPEDPRFHPWYCQERAAETEGDERRAWLDEAIDAFGRIADTPVDPGNDEGPLWAVACWLDREQVDRAFALLAEMAPHPWLHRLGGSRAALIGRLAALGDFDEAWVRIEDLERDDPFASRWRATALGAWLAAATAEALDPASGLERVGFAQLDDAQRYVLLDTVWHADGFRPDAHAAQEWLDAARSLDDPASRRLAVLHLAAAGWAALPAQAWIDAVTDERDPAMALLELTDMGGVSAMRAAESILRGAPEGDALAELLEHPHADLGVVEACARRWLHGRPGRYDLAPESLRRWLARAGIGEL